MLYSYFYLYTFIYSKMVIKGVTRPIDKRISIEQADVAADEERTRLRICGGTRGIVSDKSNPRRVAGDAL